MAATSWHMVLGGTPAEWATLLALVLGPGFVATVLWSPVLVSGQLRGLFRALPPTGSVVANYVLVSMTLSVPWIVGLGWAFAEIGSQAGTGPTSGEPLVNVALQLTLLYVVGLPVAAVAGLPRLGVDWLPGDASAGRWLLLGVASAWYAGLFAVPTFLFGLVVSLPS